MPDNSPDPPHDASTGVKRRHFLGYAGAAAGTAALLPLASGPAAAGPVPTHGGGSSLPDFSKEPPFSFTYGGTPSSELLRRWRHRRTKQSFTHGTQNTDVWTDPVTNLRVSLISEHHKKSGVVSWVVRFRNEDKIGTRLISDVLALDLTQRVKANGDWVVHTNNGSDARDEDFAPITIPLPDKQFRVFSTANGRPSDGVTASASTNPWRYQTGADAPGYINSDQHSTTTAGSIATLKFVGTSITWIGVQNVDCGKADVFIDGVEVAVVDQYATSWLKQIELFKKDDLSTGEHTIVVRSRPDKNPAGIGVNVNIDAFVVGTGAGAEIINDNDPRITYARDASSQPTFIRNGWPYFNLTWSDGGLIAAIGWQGQWALEASRDGKDLRLTAGMTQLDSLPNGAHIQEAELTELWLKPSEEFRTPQIVLLPWKGADRHVGQNIWRKWFVDEHMPKLNGAPVPPLCPTQSNDYFPEQWDTAADQLTWLNAYEANDATPSTGGTHDHWWIDAGWTPIPDGANQTWNWPGSWFPDPVRYPDGLKPILDRAREVGMRTIVWFEPERVRTGTWLHANHPEWLLNVDGGTDNFLLDFGNPAARDWAIQTIGDMIVNDGIDVYREDFNIGPLPLWRANDEHGRRGMTQIRYLEGRLAFWKALLQRSPGLVIDTCASGGRRMDVETLGLSVNFLRSDRVLDATANQTHTHGISSWVPLSGGVVRITGEPDDLYNARSCYGPSIHHALDVRQPSAPWDMLKETAAEWKELSEHLYGDYFQLTPGGPSQDVWVAWQFGQPDTSAGFVQAFRRPGNGDQSRTIKLQGLQDNKRYTVTDRDTGASQTLRGKELMRDGITVTIDSNPGAKVLEYQRV